MTSRRERGRLRRSVVSILILTIAVVAALSSSSISTVAKGHIGDVEFYQIFSLDSNSKRLIVDVYADALGRGVNQTLGTYTIGDRIRFYVFVNQNCTMEENIVTPTGDVWPRMIGPVNNGTFVEYFDTQYPTGEWAVYVKAHAESESAADTATFQVVDKSTSTITETMPPNVTGILEARFNGRIVRTYRYPVGGIQSWDVRVDLVYFGPNLEGLTVKVQALALTRTLGYPLGYVDETITLGDDVQVYGLVSQLGSEATVTLNGSQEYYIKKLSTLSQSPEILLFSREIFPSNLTVRINGIAIPGHIGAEITKISWNWGDGEFSDLQFPATHTYSKQATYIILISALQSDGLSTSKSLSITIPENFPSEGITRLPADVPLWVLFSAPIVVLIAAASILVSRRKSRK